MAHIQIFRFFASRQSILSAYSINVNNTFEHTLTKEKQFQIQTSARGMGKKCTLKSLFYISNAHAWHPKNVLILVWFHTIFFFLSLNGVQLTAKQFIVHTHKRIFSFNLNKNANEFSTQFQKNGESSRLPQNFVFSVQFFNFYYTFFSRLKSPNSTRNRLMSRWLFFSLELLYACNRIYWSGTTPNCVCIHAQWK